MSILSDLLNEYQKRREEAVQALENAKQSKALYEESRNLDSFRFKAVDILEDFHKRHNGGGHPIAKENGDLALREFDELKAKLSEHQDAPNIYDVQFLQNRVDVYAKLIELAQEEHTKQQASR